MRLRSLAMAEPSANTEADAPPLRPVVTKGGDQSKLANNAAQILETPPAPSEPARTAGGGLRPLSSHRRSSGSSNIGAPDSKESDALGSCVLLQLHIL